MKRPVKMFEKSHVDQEDLFDQLADQYDLLLTDWEEDLKLQGQQLDRLFREYADAPIRFVLDCTCGIGTQSIALALQGYRVTGTDISGKSIERAAKEAVRFNVVADFLKADIRRLDQVIDAQFDAVISCDNSLPTLLTDDDIATALDQMARHLNPSGLCLISIRNYDKIFQEKKRFNPRHIHEIDGKRIVVFDLWDYENDDVVIFNVFFLYEQDSGWKVNCRKMVWRALYRERFTNALTNAGFRNIHVITELDGETLPFNFYICKKPPA